MPFAEEIRDRELRRVEVADGQVADRNSGGDQGARLGRHPEDLGADEAADDGRERSVGAFFGPEVGDDLHGGGDYRRNYLLLSSRPYALVQVLSPRPSARLPATPRSSRTSCSTRAGMIRRVAAGIYSLHAARPALAPEGRARSSARRSTARAPSRSSCRSCQPRSSGRRSAAGTATPRRRSSSTSRTARTASTASRRRPRRPSRPWSAGRDARTGSCRSRSTRSGRSSATRSGRASASCAGASS